MGELRLTSISVDDLRALFSGSPGIENHLRTVVASAYPDPVAPARGGLLSKVGPVTKLPPPNAPTVKPNAPTAADLHDVTHGRFIKPARLEAAWALVRLWLDATGWPTIVLSIDEPAINDLDFELATGGVETRFALRRLLNERLALPLRPAAGQVTGFVGYADTIAMRDAWRTAIPTLSPHNAELARYITGWLDGMESWAEHARRTGRPLPDLIASFTQA